MAYTLSWETQNPGLMIFLVDQSGSMRFNLGTQKRSQVVVEDTREILEELLGYCQKGTEIRNKFKCIIIGYSDKAEICYDKNAMEINNDIETGHSILEAKESGLTNMEDAFKMASNKIKEWIEFQQKKGVPIPAPRVVNITDGHPEMRGVPDDKAMEKAETAARELMGVQTDDGKVMLSNIFLYSCNIRFPQQIDEVNKSIKEDWARTNAEFLFRISSEISEASVANAASKGLTVDIGSRLLLCSDNPEDILKFLDYASHPKMSPPYPIG